jgi:uncharacterized protein YlzI (FlbEa/FlbD family)
MNFIKLTKNGQPVLLNFNEVDQVEQLHTKNGVMSKVIFKNGNYCIVQETLVEVFEILDKVYSGEKQEIDWTTQSIDQLFTEDYQQQRPHYHKPRRSYNTNYARGYGNFNENQY